MAEQRRASTNLLVFLALLGLAMLGGWIWLADLQPLRGPPLLQFIPRYLALFAGYIGCVWVVLRFLRRRSNDPSGQTGVLILIVILGLAFRLPLLSSPPTLSDDVYRYLWDGTVIRAGTNPYAHAVQSSQLAGLNDSLQAQVNNPQMASPYLPSAQALFYVLAQGRLNTPLTYQVAMVGLDLATVIAIVWILRRLKRPAILCLVYFWNPLVVVEFAHGAHIDAWMNALMLFGLGAALTHKRSLISPLLMAAATLVKPIPLLLAPLLASRWRVRGSLVYVAGLAAGLLPFSGAGWGIGSEAGTGVFGAIALYARYWNFNSGLYHGLESLLTGHRGPGAADSAAAGVVAARVIVLAALAGVVLWSAWRSWRLENDQPDDADALYPWVFLCPVPVGAYLLLTTTVNPWYLTTLLALLPLWAWGRWGWLRIAPWLYFSAAVALSYLTYLDPANLRETAFTRRWEYFPLLILLGLSALIPRLAGGGLEPN